MPAVFAATLEVFSAHAQFGSGIVYDPTQSAHAAQQISKRTTSIPQRSKQNGTLLAHIISRRRWPIFRGRSTLPITTWAAKNGILT